MGLRNFLAGITVGVISTYVIQKLIPTYISSDNALSLVKQEMKKQGPIDGSWIHMEPETIVRNYVSYRVYRGGISRVIGNRSEQLEFLVNADNGTIIEMRVTT
jgi:predicted small secreted protein